MARCKLHGRAYCLNETCRARERDAPSGSHWDPNPLYEVPMVEEPVNDAAMRGYPADAGHTASDGTYE